MAGELLEFTKNGTLGIALNLTAGQVGIIIMGEYTYIEEGDLVRSTGRIASVPVGDALIGRVINAVGQPIDGKGPIETRQVPPCGTHCPRCDHAPAGEYAGSDRYHRHRCLDPHRSRPA